MSEDTLLTSALQAFGPKPFTRISQSEMCEALGLLDQKQMADRLGLSYDAFRWRVSKGRLPKPTFILRRRAYYTAEQMNALENGLPDSNTSEKDDHMETKYDGTRNRPT